VIEQLFGSKTRVKLLQLFFGNPNRAFYVREITRKIDEQINSVRRELSNLLSIGIISSETNNNRLYYEVNQQYGFYGALSAIFGADAKKEPAKTPVATKQQDELQSLRELGRVDLAIYTGQLTRDETSGTDFLLVGDINQTKLAKYISELEAKEGKEIRYTVLSEKDFNYRQQVKDRFLSDVLAAKKQILIDKNDVLAQGT
jgi:hypothetical protein